MARRNRKPSAPRQIGHANDDAPLVANDAVRVKEGPSARLLRQMLSRAHAEQAEAAYRMAPKPEREEPLTHDQLKRLRKAERKLRSNDPAVKAAGMADMAKIEGERRARADLARRDAAIGETLELERLRDPTVKADVSSAQTTKGRIHLANRDGMAMLLSRGSITKEQARAGMVYRGQWEAANRSLKSGLNFIGGAAANDGADPAAAARREVVRFERLVVNSTDKANEQGRRLLCLREIAGAGRPMTDLSGKGESLKRHMLSLRAALDAIA